MESILYVGLDVHKKSIEVALAEGGPGDETRRYGRIDGEPGALDKVVRKLVSTGKQLRFVYEAGPCGYEIYRHLNSQGYHCVVVAPSQVPRRSGDRIKNDRRDAMALARLHRAGELTAVYVPTPEDEAMRDLVRGREDAKRDERKAKQRLGAFLLRHGYRYQGRRNWTLAHMRWISDIKMPHTAQQVTMQEYIAAIHEHGERVDRLTDQIREMMTTWTMAPVVQALQSLRGVSLIVAATAVSELGDLGRFATSSELMAYLGLVPSENSSGDRNRRGSITKTGNNHVRRALVEAAWTYRLPPRVSRVLLKRQEGLPQNIRDISWKAQLRLCGRYRSMMARGKTKQVVITAIARELAAYMWAIAREVKIPA
jgi:transposase